MLIVAADPYHAGCAVVDGFARRPALDAIRLLDMACFCHLDTHHRREMKKAMHIDGHLLARAKLACGATTDTETVRRGLEALIRHATHRHLRALRGTEPAADDVSRRRGLPRSTRRTKARTM
jgi:Arc/MetJ family transcription regulator